MKKRRLLWLLLLVPVAGLATVPNVVESSIPSIYYITPSQRTYENTINCTGTIQSARVRQIVAPEAFVPGEITVEAGDIVREGDILLRIDPDATAALPANAIGSFAGELTGSVQQTLEGVDLSALAAAYGLSSLLGGTVDLQGIAGMLRTPSESMQMETIVYSPEFTEFSAPFSGIVTEVNASSQTPAAAGKAIFTILDNKNYLAIVQVPEGDISKIKVGDSATVRGVGFSGTSYKGTVTKIYPTARTTLAGTSTETVVDMEVTIQRPDNRLKHGFSAKVEISGGAEYELITVPYEAIRQDENNDEYVYTYENGMLRKASVVTGQELTNVVEILDGLDADSVVVYNPDDVAGEGTMVSIKGRAHVD